MLLPEVDAKGAALMAEKVRKLVEKHMFEFDKQEIAVTISLGVATLKTGQRDSADLVRAADSKLYEAKTSGRNRVCT